MMARKLGMRLEGRFRQIPTRIYNRSNQEPQPEQASFAGGPKINATVVQQSPRTLKSNPPTIPWTSPATPMKEVHRFVPFEELLTR
jgi:hypothetical protein